MVGPNFMKTICTFRLLVFVIFFSFLFSQLFTIIWKILQVFKKVINEATGFPSTNVLFFGVKSCMFCN